MENLTINDSQEMINHYHEFPIATLMVIICRKNRMLSDGAKILFATLVFTLLQSYRLNQLCGDEKGIYIHISQEGVARTLHKSARSVRRMMRELKDNGLISIDRVGSNEYRTRIYKGW